MVLIIPETEPTYTALSTVGYIQWVYEEKGAYTLIETQSDHTQHHIWSTLTHVVSTPHLNSNPTRQHTHYLSAAGLYYHSLHVVTTHDIHCPLAGTQTSSYMHAYTEDIHVGMA